MCMLVFICAVVLLNLHLDADISRVNFSCASGLSSFQCMHFFGLESIILNISLIMEGLEIPWYLYCCLLGIYMGMVCSLSISSDVPVHDDLSNNVLPYW